MSPTIIYSRGFAIKIYYNDHPPAHVHVMKDGKRAKVLLSPARLWESDMKDGDTRQAVNLVKKNHDRLIAEWDMIHGSDDDTDTLK